MRIVVVGAGAMGASYGGLLSVAGEEVGLVDARPDHVGAIRGDGLRVSGVFGEHVVRLPAAESPEGLEPSAGGWADLVIVFTDSNATREAARRRGPRTTSSPPGAARSPSRTGSGTSRRSRRSSGRSGCSAARACAAPSSRHPATWR